MADGLYHVTVRGWERRRIVRSDRDREDWLRLLDRVAGRSDWRVFAWVLMSNHFHLYLRTPDPTRLEDGRPRRGFSSRRSKTVGELRSDEQDVPDRRRLKWNKSECVTCAVLACGSPPPHLRIGITNNCWRRCARESLLQSPFVELLESRAGGPPTVPHAPINPSRETD
jgi:REP element-mobilizing transposase RayT